MVNNVTATKHEYREQINVQVNMHWQLATLPSRYRVCELIRAELNQPVNPPLAFGQLIEMTVFMIDGCLTAFQHR